MPTAETIPSSLPIAERFGVTVPVAASYSGISKSRDLLRANCFRRRTGAVGETLLANVRPAG
jgi:hypothetical protein